MEDEVYYKVGITTRSPEQRLKELQTGNALKLELVHTYKSKYGTILESTLHRTYCLEHQTGEWFSLSDDQVRDFLNNCITIENNLELVFQSTYMEGKKRI